MIAALAAMGKWQIDPRNAAVAVQSFGCIGNISLKSCGNKEQNIIAINYFSRDYYNEKRYWHTASNTSQEPT